VFKEYRKDIELQMQSVNAWKRELAMQIKAFSDDKSELSRGVCTKQLAGFIIAHLQREDRKADKRLKQLHKQSQNAWLQIFRLKMMQQKMVEEYYSTAKGLEKMDEVIEIAFSA
jgi:hypothetical protein